MHGKQIHSEHIKLSILWMKLVLTSSQNLLLLMVQTYASSANVRLTKQKHKKLYTGIPQLSVASGLDWGKNFEERPLSFLEMCVIATSRLYMW